MCIMDTEIREAFKKYKKGSEKIYVMLLKAESQIHLAKRKKNHAQKAIYFLIPLYVILDKIKLQG